MGTIDGCLLRFACADDPFLDLSLEQSRVFVTVH